MEHSQRADIGAIDVSEQMSRQRPTLQLGDWKIATNLTATRSLQNDPSYPAHRCECHWCVEWTRLHAAILPPAILSQFSRIGILPSHPTDLYKYGSDATSDHLRVIFSIVGRVMCGPDTWIQSEAFGPSRSYHTLRIDPFLSLVVLRHEDLHYQAPTSYNPADGHYLLADFRLAIPFAISARSDPRIEMPDRPQQAT